MTAHLPRRFVAAIAVLATSGLPWAAISAQQQQPPTFRGGGALVGVDVTVLDKDGRPIPGLSAEDFQITLNGHEIVTLIRSIDQPLQVSEALLSVEIQAKLRRLHRYVRAETLKGNPVDHLEIVPGDVFGVFNASEVLTEPCEDRVDAVPLLHNSHSNGVVDPFAGHECRNGPANETGPRGAVAQPDAGGSRQKHRSCDAHRGAF